MSEQKRERVLQGRVVSNKMEATIVVLVETQRRHKLYKKIIRRSLKVHAHDAENSCEMGDIVKIKETRPLSKTKSWALVEVVERRN
ncbi:MAG: 30S ribosomal protein S17 [Gammaproteobacteria bacterium]|nr:30S ribosomal protein S17 [Gammaproteobacteria bacterium]